MKHTKYFGNVVLIVILLIVGINEISKYTTFEKLFSDQINKNSVVDHIDISIRDTSSIIPITTASVRIEDVAIIESILNDLSDIKLKKNKDANNERKYYIQILTSNRVDKKIFTNYTVFGLDENYLDDYKITNKTNHLDTIISLIENDEIEWSYN